jgi:hypothetical protein
MTRAGDDAEQGSDVGHAPLPLRGWGYPHPLAGERSGAHEPRRRRCRAQR